MAPAVARFLDPRRTGSSSALLAAEADESISRAQSILNLTASTLFGIYGPATPPRLPRRLLRRHARHAVGLRRRDARQAAEPGRRHLRHASQDGAGRREPPEPPVAPHFGPAPPRRRPCASAACSPSSRAPRCCSPSASATASWSPSCSCASASPALPLAVHQTDTGSAAHDVYAWACLAFWGLAGVALGMLLPWFDGVWDSSTSTSTDTASATATPRRHRPARQGGHRLGPGGAQHRRLCRHRLCHCKLAMQCPAPSSATHHPR